MLSFITFLFFGCKEKDVIEVIPNYDEIYLPISKVDSTPKLIEGNEKELSDRINEEIKKSSASEVRLDYNLLIDENGNVQKVKVVECPDNKYTNLVVKEFENWKFEPGKKNGKSVKAQYRWYFNLTNHWTESATINKTNINDYLLEVDKMPEPIGGTYAIQEKVVYPEIAKRAGIEGKIFVKAFIDEKGDVVAAEIIKGIGSGLNEAAVNAIRQTKFSPAIHRGKPVKVQVVIPILFKLG